MRDTDLLDALLASERLTPRERDVFTSMRRRVPVLSQSQRAWAQDVGYRIGLRGVERAGFQPRLEDPPRPKALTKTGLPRMRGVRQIEREARELSEDLQRMGVTVSRSGRAARASATRSQEKP